MQILNLRIENFLSAEEIELPLANLGLTLIEGENRDQGGSNGAGKSTIIDALRWCLFGTLGRDLKGDDVVRLDADKKPVKNTRVVVDLEVDNSRVRVVRHRKHSQYGNKLLLYVDDKEITMGGDKETQEKLEKLIQIDGDSFVNAVMFPQGAAGFPSLSDAQQKEIFDKLLGLQRFSDAQERVKAKHKRVQASLLSVRAIRVGKYQQIEQLKSHIESLQTSQGNFANQKQQKIQSLTANLAAHEGCSPPRDNTIDAQIAQIRQSVTDLRLNEKYANLQEQQRKFSEVEKLHVATRSRLDTLRSQVAAAGPQPKVPDQDVTSLATRIADLSAEKSGISGSLKVARDRLAVIDTTRKNRDAATTCRTCGQELSQEAKDRMFGALSTEEETLRGEVDRLSTRFMEVQTLVQHLSQNLAAANAEVAAYTRWQSLASAASQIPETEIALGKLSNDVSAAKFEEQAAAEIYRIDYGKASEAAVVVDRLSKQKQTEEHAFAVWNSTLSTLRNQLHQAQQEQSPYEALIQKAQKDLFAAEASVKLSEIVERTLGEQSQYLEFWANGFGNSGVKSLLLDTVAPYLSFQASTYMEAITGGTGRIEFSTQTRLRTGEFRDKFGVEASYAFGGNKYGGVSGGEKRRVDLCCLLALGDLAASRSFLPIAMKFFDEPFENLDGPGAEQVVMLLKNYVADKYKTVLIVTHDENLKALIPNRLTVIKEGGISRILQS